MPVVTAWGTPRTLVSLTVAVLKTQNCRTKPMSLSVADWLKLSSFVLFCPFVGRLTLYWDYTGVRGQRERLANRGCICTHAHPTYRRSHASPSSNTYTTRFRNGGAGPQRRGAAFFGTGWPSK